VRRREQTIARPPSQIEGTKMANKQWTVKDLIEALKKYPSEAKPDLPYKPYANKLGAPEPPYEPYKGI
jgi:hypothetical protein